jgi:hypothetical protein
LRQEHEKVKMQYEQRIKDLQSSPTPSAAPNKSEATGGSGPFKNLTAANAKVKDLEKEVERVRTFYTKKLDEAQRRADTQMRSLKRGDLQEEVEVVSVPAAAVAQYELRISMLEKELMQTSEELGRARSAAVNLPPPPAAASVTVAAPLPVPAYVDMPPQIPMSTPLSSSNADTERLALLSDKVSDLSSQLALARYDAVEKSKSLDEKNAENSDLRSQVDNVKVELQLKVVEMAGARGQSPEMTHFLSLEGQLHRLEEKISRREGELQALLEETKAAARIERSRLQSIHAQELTEKDEQLSRSKNLTLAVVWKAH